MQLLLALYAEGPSDTRFLPIIIQRTARSITGQHRSIDVLDLTIISKKQGACEECILHAARDAYGCHALIVHSDADDKTSVRAHKERIQPGFDLVLKFKSSEEVCEHLIPLIPVQMTEAWMLADGEALLDVIGANRGPQDLRLPKASEVERDANPKRTLNEIVRNVNLNRCSSKRSSYRRKIDIDSRYEHLAGSIDLSKLAFVPSYKAFRDDLTEVLISILDYENR